MHTGGKATPERALAALGDGVSTAAEWLSRFPGHRAYKFTLMRQLLASGDVVHVCGTGKRSDPRRYQRRSDGIGVSKLSEL